MRGYIVTDKEGFNEIVTLEPVISENKWINIVFERSASSGMHLYVDGEEKNIMITEGTQSPTGKIERSTYLYVGHDANTIIDELVIKNTISNSPESYFWETPNKLSNYRHYVVISGNNSILLSEKEEQENNKHSE